MTTITRPRYSLALGVLFIAAAVVYAAGATPLGYRVEWAGVTMLFALGIAMTLMAWVLATSPRD
jgi:hypothetical protein